MLDERKLLERERQALIVELDDHSSALQKVVAIRRELQAVWSRSMATREQLVAQLQDWCQRAEQSGIAPLADFSNQLRSYQLDKTLNQTE